MRTLARRMSSEPCPSIESRDVRLKRCDISRCEAMCCHDGAYLTRRDETRLRAALRSYPEHFAHVPPEPVVEGVWQGKPSGRKTATRPWTYQRTIPAHFTHTRCVFTQPNGFCSLETAARANGLHPWTFKPAVCYLFPIDRDYAGPAAPGQDPYDLGPSYPGFNTVIDCGRHFADGQPWREVLQDELATEQTPIDALFAEWRQQQPRPSSTKRPKL